MHRFYCPDADFSQNEFTLSEQKEIHHLRNVLKLKTKEKISVFNKNGEGVTGQIQSVSPQGIKIKVLSKEKQTQKSIRIILACALPKKSKFETIIEKATELGADEIIPMVTKRADVKFTNERLDKKLIRFASIALNAAKQSKRATIPAISPLTNFKDAVDKQIKCSQVIIPSLQGARIPILKALSTLKSPKAITLLIGPEGDFTDDEYAYARKKGALAVSLGDTVLKVETAALAALSSVALYFSK